jgi:hypothetical protein
MNPIVGRNGQLAKSSATHEIYCLPVRAGMYKASCSLPGEMCVELLEGIVEIQAFWPCRRNLSLKCRSCINGRLGYRNTSRNCHRMSKLLAPLGVENAQNTYHFRVLARQPRMSECAIFFGLKVCRVARYGCAEGIWYFTLPHFRTT